MPRISRRRFLQYALAAAGTGAIALGVGDALLPQLTSGGTSSSTTSSTSSVSSTSSATSTVYSSLPDYQDFLTWLNSVSKPYAGGTLNITLEEEFTPLTLQIQDNDFLNATGISDQYSIKPYSLQLTDVSLMFHTQSSTFDVFGVDNQNLGVFPDYSISPSQLSQDYPELTYPDLDLADFNRFLWDRVATYPQILSPGASASTTTGAPVLPLDTPTLILYYRKDIFSELGLNAPVTWDDHYSNVQAIQKSGKTPYASVSMAAPDISIVYEFLSHVASFGANLWNVDGNTITPNLTDDKVLAALENFVRFRPYSDPSSEAYTWDEVFNSLGRGASATGLLWDGYATWSTDPSRAPVAAGNFAFAKAPSGPMGSFSTLGSSGVGVSKFSKNPKMAWLWLQWATAKGTEEAMILNRYHVYPTRDSVIQAPEVSAGLAQGSLDIAQLTNEIFQSNSLAALIGFPMWFYVLQDLAPNLNSAWAGAQTPARALATAQTAIETLGTLSF